VLKHAKAAAGELVSVVAGQFKPKVAGIFGRTGACDQTREIFVYLSEPGAH